MITVNLRDLYPGFYEDNILIAVTDEIAEAIKQHDRMEAAQRRRIYYHKAHYSLDRGDGIENEALSFGMTPDECCEYNQETQDLYAALASLPAIQSRRVIKRYIMGMSVSEIAKREGVSSASVSESIKLGLKRLRTFLNELWMLP